MSYVIHGRQDFLAGWVAAKIGAPIFHRFAAVGLAARVGQRENLIAAVVYDQFQGHDVHGHMAVEGRLTREFLYEVFRLPYEVLGVRRITVCTTPENEKAVRFIRQLGFELEGRQRGGSPDGGDRLIFGQDRAGAEKWLSFRSR